MSPLLAILLIQTIPVSGVVDRVEGDWAVVEWCGQALEDLPLKLLPRDLREGEPLRASLDPDPRGSWRREEDQAVLGSGPEAVQIPIPRGRSRATRFTVRFEAGRRGLRRCGPAPRAPASSTRATSRSPSTQGL